MHELLPKLIFDVFAGIALLSALLVITQNNPVRCVLFLVLTFICSAVLWMLVEAEFLALILVLVYVGAVMTLFLFVVMMLNIDTESMKRHFIRYLPFGLMGGALLIALLLKVLPKNGFQTQDMPSSSLSNTEALGMVLYTDYVLAFELAAVILLVAIIAAITLVQRHLARSKRQDIVKQIKTRREDRVTLIQMKPEKEA